MLMEEMKGWETTFLMWEIHKDMITNFTAS